MTDNDLPTSAPDVILADPRERAAAAPYTFFPPSTIETDAIDVGDTVKLNFEYLHEVDSWGGERMWVLVVGAAQDELIGELRSRPDEPKSQLQFGQVVRFRRHHALDVDWREGFSPPIVLPRREYWERCLVDQCVLDGEPVGYLYREAPDLASPDDVYPDSGWRIRARVLGVTDDELAEREVAYVALGAVLNRDDSWLPWIDAPIGVALERDPVTGEYCEDVSN